MIRTYNMNLSGCLSDSKFLSVDMLPKKNETRYLLAKSSESRKGVKSFVSVGGRYPIQNYTD